MQKKCRRRKRKGEKKNMEKGKLEERKTWGRDEARKKGKEGEIN